MFIERLNNEQLKVLSRKILQGQSIYRDLNDNLYIFERKRENVAFNNLNDETMLMKSDSDIPREFIKFMEQIFGKEFIMYVLEYYNIPLDLIEKHYGYSDDDWEETK